MAEAEDSETSGGQNPSPPTEDVEGETEEPLEGSQYDPEEEYPEEDYAEYSDENTGAWMGGIRVIEEDNQDEESSAWL